MKKGKPIKDLASVVDYVKPTVLLGMSNWLDDSIAKMYIDLGASGVSRLFHEGVLKKMAQINERPVIFALYVYIELHVLFFTNPFV